jgi:hypothetical protein
VTSDAQLIAFRSLRESPEILACRVVLRTILACAANDFTVSHQTNSLPGNKMFVVPLKKFLFQKFHNLHPLRSFSKAVTL